MSRQFDIINELEIDYGVQLHANDIPDILCDGNRKAFGVINRTGQTYGELLVMGIHRQRLGSRKKLAWDCLCSCGKLREGILSENLHSGHTRSCGHLLQNNGKIHGGTAKGADGLYSVYQSAKERCRNKNNSSYPRYGGRGIQFLFTSFEQFRDALGKRPTSSHTVDRKNNEGHYEPGNIQWATRIEQAQNTRSVRNVIVNGQSLCLSEWSRRLGFASTSGVSTRLRQGWCEACATTKPLGGFCEHQEGN